MAKTLRKLTGSFIIEEYPFITLNSTQISTIINIMDSRTNDPYKTTRSRKESERNRIHHALYSTHQALCKADMHGSRVSSELIQIEIALIITGLIQYEDLYNVSFVKELAEVNND